MAESKTPIARDPNTTHTPLPWKIAGWEIDAADGRRIANFDNSLLRRQDSVKGNEAKANAELIVRAVNSHQDLLEACKAIYQCIESRMLVRSIADDHEPGWALRQLPLVRALGQLKEAIEKAEADHS